MKKLNDARLIIPEFQNLNRADLSEVVWEWRVECDDFHAGLHGGSCSYTPQRDASQHIGCNLSRVFFRQQHFNFFQV